MELGLVIILAWQQEVNKTHILRILHIEAIQGRISAGIVNNQDILQMIAPPKFPANILLNLPDPRIQELLQVKLPVTLVGQHVHCELLIQKVIREDSSIHANHKNATFLYGLTIWKMVRLEDVVDPVGAPAGCLPPRGEVVMPGVKEVGVPAAAHLYQQLENQYQVAALYAVTPPILQMPAPVAAGNSFESSRVALFATPHHLLLLLYVFIVHWLSENVL